MEEERPDLISSLPYEILQQIVSLIPLKEAIRTGILSAAWMSLWTPFQVNLEFDSDDQITSHVASEKMKQIMGMFLGSYDSPQLLKLSLSYPKGDDKKSFKVMDELFFIATKGIDKELHLDFSMGKQETSNFSLILEQNCPSLEATSFASLTTLHLRSVTQLTGHLVSLLLSGCRLLETLKLEKCSGLQSINIKANNFLQSFIAVDCPNMVNITLSAPNLKSFRYQGVLPNIELESTPHLVDVRLNLKDGLGHSHFDCEDALFLLASLKDVEFLTISGWLLEWLCTAGVIFARLDFQFNKLKELWWIDSLMDRPKRDSLACFLNITPSLEKLFVKINYQNCSSIPCPWFHQCWHEPHLWMDYANVKSNTSQLKHLKIIRLMGFTNTEDQLLLMDLFLHKAVTLKVLTVTSPENHSWLVRKIPQSQMKQASRGYPKRTVVSSPNMEGFFVLTEEDNNDFFLANGRC